MGGSTLLETYANERRNTLSGGKDNMQRLKLITTGGRKISTNAPAKSPIMTLNDGFEMPAFGLGTSDRSVSKTGKIFHLLKLGQLETY